MAVFKEWPGIRYIMQLIIMNLVSCLACLSAIAFAQLEFTEAVTGSVSFPDGAIACLGNFAVFFTCLLRRRLELENGARDVLATNRGPKLKKINGRLDLDLENGARDVLATNRGSKLQKINGSGLTTCDGDNYEDAKVVMLSGDMSDSNSIKQFMKYIHHSHGVHSILLKYLPLRFEAVTAKTECPHDDYDCTCILLQVEEEETKMMIASRMPGTLKRLSDSLCLLPCWNCLESGCHGCDQGMLHVKERVERPECIRLQSADVKAELCCDQFHECMCNVLWTDEEHIRMMVARWMPGTVKRLSNSLCLLPSWDCLRRGCHGLLQTEEEESKAESCGQIQNDVEEIPRRLLIEEGFKAESPAAVCQMLDNSWFSNDVIDCICIPLCERGDDEWTKLMIRFLRSKDEVAREVRVMSSDVMEKYIDGSRESSGCFEIYRSWSLIVPRLIEISLNIVLAFGLRVDGLSSSLIARRVVRDHIVDCKGTGFNANAFIGRAQVQCNEGSVCQRLRFRGKILRVRTLSYIVGSVNLICAMIWCVLIACEGRYCIPSMAPSNPRLVVMLASIAVALLMDFPMFLESVDDTLEQGFRENRSNIIKVCGMILLEIGYLVSGSVIVVKRMGMGRWLYSAFQVLIWVKWGIGSYFLGDRDARVDFASTLSKYRSSRSSPMGIMTYSSAFMLNAILAGVRGKWKS